MSLATVATLAMGCLLASVVPCAADTPNPVNNTVDPMDAMHGAVLAPQAGALITVSVVQISVANSAGDPIPGSTVKIEFLPGNPLCPSGVLQATSDLNGECTITLSGSGCVVEINAVIVKASGVTIREYLNAKSPDFDGAVGNGSVGVEDLLAFSREFLGVDPPGCHDYTNDGGTGIEDLIIFGAAFLGGNSCL